MKVAILPHFGGPDVLEVAERPTPVPRAREILVRVAAAGVNRADVLERKGLYRGPEGTPPWPGLEVAGVVADIGPGVTGFAVGDAVVALLPGGGYAEYAAVDEALALPRPAGVTDAEAASLIEAACTIWSALDQAGASTGTRVLIHGGSGGVGTLGIQIARALGMTVAATAGGPERAARCRDLGAAVAIDYRGEDFVDRVAELGGVDVVIDCVGGEYLARNLAALRPDGALVVIGLQAGAIAELNLATLLSKRIRIIGTTLRSRPREQRAAIVANVGEHVWPLIPQRVRPVVHAQIPLADVVQAHRIMDGHEAFGKVVLTM